MKMMLRGGILCVLVAMVAMTGMSCSTGGGFPITVRMPITLVYDMTIEEFEELPPGTPLLPIPVFIPMCDLPTSQDMQQMIVDTVGDQLGSLVELDSLELVALTLEASTGDFNDLTSMSLAWQPKPVDAVPQDEIPLGEAEDDDGLGTDVELTGADSVDLLELIEADEANPAIGCPGLNVVVEGVAPDVAPVFDVVATLDVTVLVSL